ncbi:hypothetical protein ABPG77_006320 [Micractinium sp. CCAP 211/92]
MGAAPPAGGPANTQAAAQGRLSPSELSFDTVCRLMNALRLTKSAMKKRDMLQKFIAVNIEKQSHDAFSVFRLLLPGIDNKRGNYHLLEGKLASVLLKAANIDRNSPEGQAVREWRKPGSRSAGNFADVVKHHILDSFCYKRGDVEAEARTLKVGELNRQLDRLTESAETEHQAKVIRHLFTVTTPEQMAWIVQIILKNLKINCSDTTILKAWHKDAFEYFNNSGMDMEFIFNEMIDDSKRFSANLRPGNAVRPQMATATNSAAWAAEYMARSHGGRFLLETKLDGERMQVHRCRPPPGTAGPDTVSYFSRKAIEHGERSNYSVMDEVIRRATPGPCILDGELIVWNKKRGVFAPFSSLKPVISAIMDKKQPGEKIDFNAVDERVAAVRDEAYEGMEVQGCELVYVAFDILHNGTSVLNMEPLETRLRLLRQFVKSGESVPLPGSCICGRVEAVVPGETRFAGRLLSREGRTADDIQKAMEEAMRLRDEGIMIKALDSHWTPNDRSHRWLKFKPDYLVGMEMDAVVIGAWGGKGGRGDLYTQYLVALAEPPEGDAPVRKWVSFCRVGSGLDNDERKTVHDILEPLCQENPPPGLYMLTGQEKPDAWVRDPARSLCFQITADLRTIRSIVFATGYSLRFPRIQCVRYNKDGLSANTTADLQHWVDQESRREHDQAEKALEQLRNPDEGGSKAKRKRGKRDRGPAPKRQRPTTIGHSALGENVVKVEAESEALQGCKVYIANFQGYNKAELQAMVKRLGGMPTAMYIGSVTHILAANDKGSEVAKHRQHDRDVICIQWLLDCAREGRRIAVPPRYYIHRSRASILADPTVDSLGDAFFSDVEPADVNILLSRALRPGQASVGELAASLAQPSALDDTDDEMQAQAGLVRRPAAWDALAAYIDAQLASVGGLDRRFSALRSCLVTLLRLGHGAAGDGGSSGLNSGGGGNARQQGQQEGDGSIADDGQLFPSVRRLVQQGQASLARLQEVQAATAAVEVRLMGGSVAPAIGKQVTHVVGIVLPQQEAAPGPGGGRLLRPARPAPEALLQAVAEEQHGGSTAVATFHLGLGSGSMRLVSDSWVHACLGRAESGAAALPPEDDFSLAPTDAGSLQAWPWQLYPAQPSSSHRAQEGRPQRAGASAGLSPIARGRRRGTAAGPARAAGHRGPPAARPVRATRAAADAPEGIASGDGQEASEGSAGEAQAAPPQRTGRFARRGGGATRRGGAAARAASRAGPVSPAAAAELGPAAAEPGPPAADEASAAPPGVVLMPEAINAEAAGGGALQHEQAAAPPPAPIPQGAPSLYLYDALFGAANSSAGPAAAAPAPAPAAGAPAPAASDTQPAVHAPPGLAPPAAALPGESAAAGALQLEALAAPAPVGPGAAPASRPRGRLKDRVARLAGGPSET